MRTFRLAGLAGFLALAAAAGFAADEPRKPAHKSVGFDASLVDKTVKPCANFYQYACGGWLAANPIPPEDARS